MLDDRNLDSFNEATLGCMLLTTQPQTEDLRVRPGTTELTSIPACRFSLQLGLRARLDNFRNHRRSPSGGIERLFLGGALARFGDAVYPFFTVKILPEHRNTPHRRHECLFVICGGGE